MLHCGYWCCGRLINDGVQLQCGPQVISDRVAVEKAGYISQNQTFGPVGAAIRYTTFTAHPFQSPGAPCCASHRCAPTAWDFWTCFSYVFKHFREHVRE